MDRWARQFQSGSPDWTAIAAAYAAQRKPEDDAIAAADTAEVWDLLDAALPTAAQALAERCDIALGPSEAIIGYDDPNLCGFAHELAAVLGDILLDCALPAAVRVCATGPGTGAAPILCDKAFTLQQEYFCYNTVLGNKTIFNEAMSADATPAMPVAQHALPQPVGTPIGAFVVPPAAVAAGWDDARWAALGPVAQAAVQVGNWRALARLIGIDRAKQLAPAGTFDDPLVAEHTRGGRDQSRSPVRPVIWRDP